MKTPDRKSRTPKKSKKKRRVDQKSKTPRKSAKKTPRRAKNSPGKKSQSPNRSGRKASTKKSVLKESNQTIIVSARKVQPASPRYSNTTYTRDTPNQSISPFRPHEPQTASKKDEELRRMLFASQESDMKENSPQKRFGNHSPMGYFNHIV